MPGRFQVIHHSQSVRNSKRQPPHKSLFNGACQTSSLSDTLKVWLDGNVATEMTTK